LINPAWFFADPITPPNAQAPARSQETSFVPTYMM
jgi:hypothetical protein